MGLGRNATRLRENVVWFYMTERFKKRELEEVSMKKIFSVVVLVALLVLLCAGSGGTDNSQRYISGKSDR